MLNSHNAPFPLYLLPSLPFRRRSSTTTTSSTASSPTCSPSTSPPTPSSFLSAAPTSHLRCYKCLSDLIPTTSIISKGFTGRYGRAYLVSAPSLSTFTPGGKLDMTNGELPNTLTHKAVPRQLVTGAHTVSDVSCRSCGSILGWKYVDAKEESQRYKIGKYILETKRVVRDGEWEGRCVDEVSAKTEGEEAVEFDSQDEDECEDLFSGVWSVGLARKRRKDRKFGRR
jgi:hypothetical protein